MRPTINTSLQIPRFRVQGLDETTEADLRAMLFAIAMIRQQTGFGTLTIEVVPDRILNMKVLQEIKPSQVPNTGEVFSP